MKRNASQNARLHLLIGKLHIDPEQKQSLVEQVSGGRVTSSADLTVRECASLISHLQNIFDRQNKKAPNDDPAVRMRRKILSICHELGWEKEQGKVDFARLNSFLLKYGYKHKELNKYSAKELPTLVTQFENLLLSADK